MPLRKIIPSWRRLDIAGVLLAWALLLIKRVFIFAMFASVPGPLSLAIIALADLLGFVLVTMLVLIFVRVIISFVGGDSRQPIVPLIHQLTEPVLAPIRKRLPASGGIDFSPMLVFLAIALMRVLIVQPLLDLGLRIGQAA
jgi:YggT family protein